MPHGPSIRCPYSLRDLCASQYRYTTRLSSSLTSNPIPDRSQLHHTNQPDVQGYMRALRLLNVAAHPLRMPLMLPQQHRKLTHINCVAVFARHLVHHTFPLLRWYFVLNTYADIPFPLRSTVGHPDTQWSQSRCVGLIHASRVRYEHCSTPPPLHRPSDQSHG